MRWKLYFSLKKHSIVHIFRNIFKNSFVTFVSAGLSF